MLRRLALDLTGLPPTPEQIAAFQADRSPQAVSRAIDSLLRSEAYGERWAMHWLDQARYADSDGYEKDDARPHAWRYRHWVIEALNADRPFDETSIEQIAGDLLPHPTADQLVATGFHRNTLTNREGGVNKEQFRFEETVDRANTVGAVWLGLTVGCAQCHDHKFDPISQRTTTASTPSSTTSRGAHARSPARRAPVPGCARTPSIASGARSCCAPTTSQTCSPPGKQGPLARAPGQDTAWDVNWDTLAKMTDGGEKYILIPADQRTELQADVVTDYFLRFYNQVVSRDEYAALGFGELRGKLQRLEQSYPQMSQARTVSELSPPRPATVHVRGGWDRPGVPVTPGVPSFLPQIEGEPQPPRLGALAVPRGQSADRPGDRQPRLAGVLRPRLGGDLRRLRNPQRPAVAPGAAGLAGAGLHRFRLEPQASAPHHRLFGDVSTVLRRASRAQRARPRQPPAGAATTTAAARRADPRRRLAADGLLNTAVGGKSVKPPMPDGVASLSYAGGFDWTVPEGPDRYRRGLYIHFQRTVPYPMLSTFDAAERTVTDCARERSNTPLQALNLLNDPVFVEAAQGLATRVILESPSHDLETRLETAYRLSLGRAPSSTERDRLAAFYQQQMSVLDSSPQTVRGLYPLTPEGYDRIVAAAWTGVSRVLLNTDEFMTRE